MNKDIEEMSNDFEDINKKDKNKDYIIVCILYVIVIILAILLIFGIKNQKQVVEDNIVSNNSRQIK